jgi:hypothetical protein
MQSSGTNGHEAGFSLEIYPQENMMVALFHSMTMFLIGTN